MNWAGACMRLRPDTIPDRRAGNRPANPRPEPRPNRLPGAARLPRARARGERPGAGSPVSGVRRTVRCWPRWPRCSVTAVPMTTPADGDRGRDRFSAAVSRRWAAFRDRSATRPQVRCCRTGDPGQDLEGPAIELGITHWSSRSPARQIGCSNVTIAKVWRKCAAAAVANGNLPILD